MSHDFEPVQDESYTEDEVFEKIREEDKRRQGKFIAVLIAAFFGGGLLGLFFSYGAGNQEAMSEFAQRLGDGLKAVSPYMVLFLAITAGAVILLLYTIARKQYAAWNREDEEEIEKIEGKLSIALMVCGIETILFFLFTMIFLDDITSGIKNQNVHGYAVRVLVFAVGFLGILVFQILGQQKIINLIKEINPEKEGSVFDFKFQKKWIESSDEAERMAIYKGSYYSYKTTGRMYVILMLFNLAGITLWDWGIVPAFMITVMWLISVVTYYVGAKK